MQVKIEKAFYVILIKYSEWSKYRLHLNIASEEKDKIETDFHKMCECYEETTHFILYNCVDGEVVKESYGRSLEQQLEKYET